MQSIKAEVIKEYNSNKNYQLVAAKFGISRQRVHQMVTGYTTVSYGRFKGRWGFSKAIKELGKKCMDCGGIGVNHHHLDGNPKHNVISNIRLLCDSCHGKAHTGFKHKESSQYRGKICKGWCSSILYIERAHRSSGYCYTCWRAKQAGRIPNRFWNRFTKCLECSKSWFSSKPFRQGYCNTCYHRIRREILKLT